jgi:3-oxoacyl-[acyl-carrier protein] reductase
MIDYGLTDKVAIVTGGSDGLGCAAAHLLATEGAKVVICGRRADYLKQAAETLSADTGGSVVAVPADVTSAADCERLVQATVDQFGKLDILVNNAGTSAAASLETVSDEDWQFDFDLKVMAAVRLSRLALPHLRAVGGGSIVNAAIGGGKAPAANALPTSLTRAAGLNLTKSLANAYAAENIRVNAICIGRIKSAQLAARAGNKPLDEFYADMGKIVPMGRVGEAEDYAHLVAFLCSKVGSYITGTSVNLDGGMCAVL